MAVVAHQPLIGLGLLDRVEVLALDVLDQRDLERRGVVEVADDDRHFVQLRRRAARQRRSPATISITRLADGPDDDRLEHAARADRLGQLVQRRLVERRRGWRGLATMSASGTHRSRVAAGADLVEQRRQAAAEPALWLSASHQIPLRAPARSITSCASAI